MESEDSSTGAINCSGSVSLDLPPGVAADGGRRTLTADIDYTVSRPRMAAARVVLRNADPIIAPLATLARVAQPRQPAAAEATNEVAPQGSKAVRAAATEPASPRRQRAIRARPSFSCASARSKGEIAVCSDAGLAALDRNMAAQYRRAIDSASPEQQAILQSTRDRFLAYRDRCPNRQCIGDAYVGRMREIRDIMEGRWQPRDKSWISVRLRAFHRRSETHNSGVTQPYIPLRVFSSFTMLEGAMEPKTIAERAAKLGFPAIALTDRNGLYGVDAVQRRLHRQGRAADHRRDAWRGAARPRSAAKRGDRLARRCSPRTSRAMPISASWCPPRISTARSRRSRMSRSPTLEGLSEGLIALTAGGEGAVARLIADGQRDKAEAYLDRLQALFPGPALHRAHPPPRCRSRKRRKRR